MERLQGQLANIPKLSSMDLSMDTQTSEKDSRRIAAQSLSKNGYQHPFPQGNISPKLDKAALSSCFLPVLCILWVTQDGEKILTLPGTCISVGDTSWIIQEGVAHQKLSAMGRTKFVLHPTHRIPGGSLLMLFGFNLCVFLISHVE